MLQNTKACMYKAMILINNFMVNRTEINYTKQRQIQLQECTILSKLGSMQAYITHMPGRI